MCIRDSINAEYGGCCDAAMDTSYKGAAGALELTDDCLVWTPRDSSAGSTVRIRFAEVKVHCMSAPGSKKAMLKVVTSSRDPKAPGYVFQFKSKLNAVFDRDTVVRGLLAGIRKLAPGPAKPASQPTPAPLKDPSEKDPGDPLSKIRVDAKPGNTKRTLTAAEMSAILVAHPALAELYRRSVPMSMSEHTFWGRYLASEELHGKGEVDLSAQSVLALGLPAVAPVAQILESEVDLSTELDLKPPEFPPGRKGVIAQLNHGAKAFVQRIAPKPAARVKSFGRLSADLGPTVDLATFSVHNKQPLKQAAVEEADVRPSKRKKTQPGLLGRELDLSAGFSQHSKAHKAMIEMMAATLTAAPKCDPLPSKLVAAHAKGSEFLRHFWAAEIAGDQPRKWELLGAVKTLLGEVCAVWQGDQGCRCEGREQRR
eukprot:TRINITY_DN18851_c0_g1_i3.p1 TRINITY_DN18851_c0_g1~~TRINITY_DN18851_c0_g1_i3.p1  ORF type:complete len:426 (-),score=94.28 TRINITY_DN18851_c0_g1_i3:167-1444(-)